MKYLMLLIVLIATPAYAGQYHARNRVARFYEPSLRVVAKSPYANPFYVPNPNYLPPSVPSWSEDTNNPHYKPDAQLGKPPKGLLDILTPGTYKIKQPEPEAYGPPPRSYQ